MRASPDDFLLPPTGAIEPSVSGSCRRFLGAACQRPEIRVLTGELSFAFASDLPALFVVQGGQRVIFTADALANPVLAALHLRHAAEIALLQRVFRDADAGFGGAVAAAFLAARCSALYFATLIAPEQEIAGPLLPAWLRAAWDRCQRDPGESTWLEQAGSREVFSGLLLLQGMQVPPEDPLWRTPASTRTLALLPGLAPLAAPSEFILASGGDSRSSLDPGTSLNNYGCSPRPRPWAVTFASSTASSISDLAYLRVERLRQRLLRRGAQAAAAEGLEECADSLRTRIAQCLGLADSPPAIIFAASGTDAELLLLYFAMAGHERPVTNIIVAPNETGSGVLNAAAARHFSALAPSGLKVRAGEVVEGFDPARITVTTIPIRDAHGNLIPPDCLDAEIATVAEQAAAAGHRVILHVVDASKTGAGAPSLALAAELEARYPGDLDVVVDACQMRLSNAELRGYLERGWPVLITGSKFFTGPPFSGAVLLPPGMAARAKQLPSPPAGLGDYLSALDWPNDWTTHRRAMPRRCNLGLLFRWEAALWEIAAFHAVPPRTRRAILDAFAQRIRNAIDASPVAQAVPARLIDRRPLGIPDSPGDFPPTIFTFIVMRERNGKRRPLSLTETQAVYAWLNADLERGALPATASMAERALARRRFHIGQPVKLLSGQEPPLGGLRISAGARLVSGSAYDPVLGPTPEARLEAELSDAAAILDKIALIVRHLEDLPDAPPPPQGDPALLSQV